MSETFTADWLALREPVDHRSRADDLLNVLGTWWETAGGSRIADLGSGTGSNLRYLAPRLSLQMVLLEILSHFWRSRTTHG